MNKSDLEKKINELLIFKEKIIKKQKEVNAEIIENRSKLYKILEQEKKDTPPPDISFLSDEGWG